MHNKKTFLKGFTLAETLVTIVIVGVVAALTVPLTIKNYQRHYTEVKLKQAYNIITNALKSAEADYGYMTTWDLSEYNQAYLPDNSQQSGTRISDALTLFMAKYFAPYLKLLKPYNNSMIRLKDVGYKNGWKYSDGSSLRGQNQYSDIIFLQNGMVIMTLIGANYQNNSFIGTSIYYYIDIDGPKGANTLNKDIFQFQTLFAKNAPIVFASGLYNWSYNNETGKVTVTGMKSLAQSKTACLNNHKSSTCGAWIESNGWKIPDDYPLL